MKRFAFYGKGGVGKSTIVSNLAVTLARMGYKVMQIGCDPKADSTMLLRHGEKTSTVLDLLRAKGNDLTLDEMVAIGAEGICCVEAGGPTPGMGCAGRGIIHALEMLKEKGAYEKFQPDIILYDVLGDVVCGGFTMPMRGQYADQVFIITSQDKMSIYAAGNIAMAVKNFAGRGYAKLGGFIENRAEDALSELNSQGEPVDQAEILATDFDSSVLTSISQSPLFRAAEAKNMTLVEAEPDSETAKEFKKLAELLLRDC